MRWRIDPTGAADIWERVAPTTETLKDRLVRPQARAYVRDVLNRLDSEEYYNPRSALQGGGRFDRCSTMTP